MLRSIDAEESMPKKELEIISDGATFPTRYGRDRVGGGYIYLDKNRKAPYVFRPEPCDKCERHFPVRDGVCKECRREDGTD